jgi:hypothetical protein
MIIQTAINQTREEAVAHKSDACNHPWSGAGVTVTSSQRHTSCVLTHLSRTSTTTTTTSPAEAAAAGRGRAGSSGRPLPLLPAPIPRQQQQRASQRTDAMRMRKHIVQQLWHQQQLSGGAASHCGGPTTTKHDSSNGVHTQHTQTAPWQAAVVHGATADATPVGSRTAKCL